MEVTPRLMFRIICSILPPILRAPNQLKYISRAFVKHDFIARELSESLADLQIWYGSVRVHRESGAWRNMVKKSQSDCTITLRMTADRVAAEWARWREGNEGAGAGSSCPVIFKHVKSDALTVWMFFFLSFTRQISHCGRKIVGTDTY